MIFVLFGTQDLMVKNRLSRVLKERLENVDDFNCVKFEGNQTLIQDIIYEATLMPLGVERKAVVVYNAPFLTGDKVKTKFENEQDFSVLEKYIDNPNEDCDLIFACNVKKLEGKSKIVKSLLSKSQVFELVDLEKGDWHKFARQLFDKYEVKIDAYALDEFVKRCNQNAYLMTNEAKKLSLFSSNISLDDVNLLVPSPIEENVFAIFDFMIKDRIDLALKIYQDLQTGNIEPVKLISILASQVRTLVDVFALKETGLSNLEVAEQLGINDYRVKLANESKKYINIEELKLLLDDLYTLDYKIKSGLIDRFLGFELLLLKFKK